MYRSTSAFGGCIAVRGVATICDALVGARKYTDFGILADASCLLVEDKRAAKSKAKEIRKRFWTLTQLGMHRL